VTTLEDNLSETGNLDIHTPSGSVDMMDMSHTNAVSVATNNFVTKLYK
jgi:hypothetical protein